MAMNPRTCIRQYVVELLKQKENGKNYFVDVGGRVYAERETQIFKQETPCIVIYFETETNQIFMGDKYTPHEYMRELRLFIDVIVGGGINTEVENQLDNYDVEDKLDHLAHQVEMLMYDDLRLGKLLKAYDPKKGDGLLEGSHLLSTTPYMVDTAGERKVAAQRMEWSLFYRVDAYIERKYTPFEVFNTKFLKVGTDTNNIEPDDILIVGAGELEQ